MYDIDSFSYWKDPAVRIKRIGIYPLDDAGKTKYFSKDSFVHHYLKMKIPPENCVFQTNESKKETNEEQKDEQSLKESKITINNLKTTFSKENKDNKEILNTEPNIERPIKIMHPVNLQSNTISTTTHNNLSKSYNMMEKNKKLKLNKLNALKRKSLARNKHIKNALFFENTKYNTIDSNKRNLVKSFDKKARLTGLKIFPNRTSKTNSKLPLIMSNFRNENRNIIQIIRTDTKEMGENYNPYNFLVPHVNRTKRNIFGSLFHS